MIQDNLIKKAEMDKRLTVMESSVMASMNSWWGPGEGDWTWEALLGAFWYSSRLITQQSGFSEMLGTFPPHKIQGKMQNTFMRASFSLAS